MQLIPFDNRDGYIWMNGDFIKWNDAKVHVLNHGLHYGSCVFEGIRVYNKKIFKLKEHVERLFLSAKILDLDINYSTQEIIEVTKKIVQKQKILDGYIRPVVWRGSEVMAISAKIGKTNILSKHKAEINGYDDALMLDYRDYIAEATGANIFFVKDNILFTPKADCFLNGITRKTVIQIAKKIGITVKEEFLELNFLSKCKEAFLTGTAVEITPISSIGDHIFENRDVTKKLIKAFKNYISQT